MFCARIDPAVDDMNGGKDVVVTEVRHASCFSIHVWLKMPLAEEDHKRKAAGHRGDLCMISVKMASLIMTRTKTNAHLAHAPLAQSNCEPVPPGPGNPYANAFKAIETPLLSVKTAQRDTNPASNRVWKMTNPKV